MVKEERYFPRAREFLPERWLPDGEHLKASHPFAHMPFGFGPRTCVGRRFAQLEMETFLSKVCNRQKHYFNWPASGDGAK